MTLAMLAAYCAQILIIVAAGAAAARLIHLPVPRARLAFWRLIVAACLLVPLVPAPPAEVFVPAVPVELATVADGAEASEPSGRAMSSWPAARVIFTAMIAGVLARLAWIGLGIVALVRLRRTGEPATLHGDLEALRHALAPRAELRWHEGIPQPVTFGWRRPIVLLPRRLGDLSIDAQRAVVCHELLHVARHDWTWMLAEDALRSVFWFHPAVWWALAQIQLAREEVVDDRVVRITGAREAYMHALVLFASEPNALATAMPFIRRRHLMSRIRQLSEEHAMSRAKLVWSATTLTLILFGSSWGAAALPLRGADTTRLMIPDPPRPVSPLAWPANAGASPSQLPDAASRQAVIDKLVGQLKELAAKLAPQNQRAQIPRASRRVSPAYPPQAARHGVEAVVTVHVIVSTAGTIMDVDVIRTRLTTEQDVDDPGYWASQPSRAFAEAAEAAAQEWVFEPPDRETTVEVAFVFVPDQELAGYAIGPPGGTRVEVREARGAGRAEVPPPSTLAPGPIPGSATPGLVPPSPSSLSLPLAPARIRVGGAIRQPMKISDARPEYPLEAKASRVQGVVIVEGVIGVDGSVIEAKVLRSIPLLDKAAIDAVRQWKFTPTLLNGAPAEVVMVVTVNFTLD